MEIKCGVEKTYSKHNAFISTKNERYI